MTENADPDDPMAQTVLGLRDILHYQVKQLHLHAFSMKYRRAENGQKLIGDQTVYSVAGPTIHMGAISGLSLLQLTDSAGLSVRDAYPIARSIVESVVNACYLMAEGSELASKAVRHAEFRSFRELHREWELGPIKLSTQWRANLDDTAKARFSELSREFLTLKGREKNWTEHSLRQRIDIAINCFEAKPLELLSSAAFMIYNLSSEVVHASYFSSLHFFGLTSPGSQRPANREQLEKIFRDHQFTVLTAAILAFASFCECFSKYSLQPHLRQESADALDKMRQLPAVADAMSQNNAAIEASIFSSP